MIINPKISRFAIYFLLGLSMTMLVPEETNAQQSGIVKFLKQRVFRRSKARKYGKKLYYQNPPPLDEYTVSKDYEIIGFEPSWLIAKEQFDEKYYYNLLSSLVLGEYDVNPETGYPRSSMTFSYHTETKVKNKKGKYVNIIEHAKSINPFLKILINVTYHGDYGGESQLAKSSTYLNFLNNDNKVQEALADSLQSHLNLLSHKFNIPKEELGIVIDFDNFNNEFQKEYSRFIKKLDEGFGEDPFLIYLKLDPVIDGENFLKPNIINEIDPYIDFFIIRSYGFEKVATQQGPVTTLESETGVSLDSTVIYYAGNGIDKNKTTIELPYFGMVWEQMRDNRFRRRRYKRYMTLDEILREGGAKKDELFQYDRDTSYAYFKKPKIGAAQNNPFSEVKETYIYFDNYITLDTKYAWIKDSMQLKGIALNALGYNDIDSKEGDRNWYVIAEYFANVQSGIGWVIAGFLLIFVPIGLRYSAFKYWQVRNVLANHRKFYNRYLMVLVGAVITAIICNIPELRDTFGLLLGAIIVFLFFLYIVVRRYITRLRRYTRYFQN